MHMRTTIDLPKDLLAEAQQLTGSATKKETVVTALEEIIKARRRQELIDMLGTVKLNLTMEDIREMRQGREPPGPGDPLVLIGPAEGRHRCPPRKNVDEIDWS